MLRPLLFMAQPKVVSLRKKSARPEPVKEASERSLKATDGTPLSAVEARKQARQRVYQSAASIVDRLIEENGGNYLTAKFLFEFAGLTGEGLEESHEESPMLRALIERAQKAAALAETEQTSEANLNLSNDECSQISR